MSCSTLRDLGCGGSFSFSCSDSELNFSAALSHFTDDIDDDVVDGEDDSDVIEDEESYIEIALDHHHHHHPKPTHDDDGGGDQLDHVDYLRISFSSSFPLPDLSNHTNPNTEDDTNIVSDPAAAVKQTAAPPSSTESLSASSTSVEDSGGSDHHVSPKRSKLPAVNRLVNTLFFSLWSSSDTTAKKITGAQGNYNINHPQLHVDNDDFVQTRYAKTMFILFYLAKTNY